MRYQWSTAATTRKTRPPTIPVGEPEARPKRSIPAPNPASILLDHLKRFALCRMSSARLGRSDRRSAHRARITTIAITVAAKMAYSAQMALPSLTEISVCFGGRASSSRSPGITLVMSPVARGFEFKLTAEADNVAIVRRALHALLGPAGLSPDRIASITLATTEVCANVVRHAYPDGSRGVIRIEASVCPDGRVTVVVGDHGVGFVRRDELETAVGLGISAALASDLRIESSSDVGTEVRMCFADAQDMSGDGDLGT